MRTPLLFLAGDGRILELIRKGDEQALVDLYASTRKMVTSYVMRNSGTSDDAEEMLQEAIITLWERVRSGNFEYRSKISTYVYATVRNMWLRRLARARREASADVDPETVPGDEQPVLEALVTSEEHQGVHAAMQKLGEPCRTVLLLFYWEEQSLEEIARRMGFANADTVKSKKYQCKKALRDIMKRAGHVRD